MKQNTSRNRWILAALFLLVGQPSQAFFSHLDTADLLKPGEYDLGIEPQYIFNSYSGLNVIGHFDMGSNNDSTNYKFTLGTGATALELGGFFKWVPIPDYGNQPGIGGYTGVVIDVVNGTTAVSLRFHPEISKKFDTFKAGTWTPYAAIPFGISFYNGQTLAPFQLAAGTKWLPSNFRHLNFWGELGINLNAAFSYLSFGLTVPFDSWNNIQFN